MEVCDDKYVLTVSEHGYGKCSRVDDYRLINRGGSGVRNINVTDKTGKVVSVRVVGDSGDVMLISRSGVLIRMPIHGISVIGRNTQGVRLMRIGEGDSVVGMAKVLESNEEEGHVETPNVVEVGDTDVTDVADSTEIDDYESEDESENDSDIEE